MAACDDCWFGLAAEGGNAGKLYCRRYPPAVLHTRTNTAGTGEVVGVNYWTCFPLVQTDGWCGEYKMRPAIVAPASVLQHVNQSLLTIKDDLAL